MDNFEEPEVVMTDRERILQLEHAQSQLIDQLNRFVVHQAPPAPPPPLPLLPHKSFLINQISTSLSHQIFLVSLQTFLNFA